MFSRRNFLKHAVLIGGASFLDPGALFVDPHRPVLHRPVSGAPVRVRGRITSGRRGIAGVAVSDGFEVTVTDRRGNYELISSDRQHHVFASMPAGYEIPRQEAGTASFFHPIRADRKGEMQANFAFSPIEGGDNQHAFLALGDTQTQTAYEMERLHAESVPDMMETAARLAVPAFGLACGDIMFDDLTMYPEYERAVRRIDLPFFQVVGNHDLNFDAPSDPGSVRTFEQHFGPSYYSFNRGEVHYVVLDDVLWHAAGYIGHIGAEQLAWLERDLAQVEQGRTVVVFLHIPALGTRFRRNTENTPPITSSVTNRAHLYRLLEPYNAYLISGHTHENEHVFEGGVHEHVLGTTCGAWWADHICYDGTPNGYAVYEANGSSLSWRYKGTGQPADHQIRVYGRGADPTAPSEVVANVWDWDPAWQVKLYVGGEYRTVMAPRIGLDPMAVELFDGSSLPAHRPWVQPVPTDHMFYAPLDEGEADVLVEATDRFGRVYTARLGS